MNRKKNYDTQAFNDHQLVSSSRLIRSIALIIGLFNLFLLIPDLINLHEPSSRIIVIVYRSVFFVMASLFVGFFNSIKTFKRLALIVTVYELVAVFIFFHIISLYPNPDFTIQLSGTFTIILVVFLIPNLWRNMLLISALIGAGFLAYSYISLEIGTKPGNFIAAAVYIAIEITLCSIFAYNFSRYKKGEFFARAELQKIYATDPLTKIGNRVKLESEAQKWMEYCKRHGLDLCLVLIDVDNLKQINDEHGHLAGDAILYEIAQIMRMQLRLNDVCVRWGGDEFVLLLPHTGIEEAKALTERIKASITEHKFKNDAVITCSFGISNMKDGLKLDEIIGRADDLMYHAKKRGKGGVGVGQGI